MEQSLDATGLATLANVPQSNICCFYHSNKEVVEPILSFVRTGLSNDEVCVFVCLDRSAIDQIIGLIKTSLPEITRLMQTGQILTFEVTQTNLEAVLVCPGKIIRTVVYFPQNTSFNSIQQLNKKLLCLGPLSKMATIWVYPLNSLGLCDALSVSSSHRFAIAKNGRKWELFENIGCRKDPPLRDDFLQIVRHELRNPIQITKAALKLVNSSIPESDGKLAKYIKLAENSVNQISAVIEDLVTVNSLEKSFSAANAVLLDFKTLVQESLVHYVANGRHKILSLFDKDKSVPVVADPVKIRQIITNILNNAAQYTPEGQRIWVDIYISDGFAVLIIEDEGIGIPDQELEKVFDRYYRASNVLSRKNGFGVGLFVSKRLARLHGGDLSVKKRRPKGTILTLSLPVASEDR